MKRAVCKLKSLSPYSQSKAILSAKGDQERFDEFEKRVWKERCHYDDKGNTFIPPMAFANSIKEAAQYANIKIPGQRNMTYTKKFNSGVMVLEGLPLGVNVNDVQGQWLFVPSDGKRGGGSRVHKCFPLFNQWHGIVEYWILDDVITQNIFERVLKVSGSLIGIGQFRPANRGFYGRFECTDMQWLEEAA